VLWKAIVGRSVLARGMPLLVGIHSTYGSGVEKARLVLVLSRDDVREPSPLGVAHPYPNEQTHFFLWDTERLEPGEYTLALITEVGELPIDSPVWILSDSQFSDWFNERAEPVAERAEPVAAKWTTLTRIPLSELLRRHLCHRMTELAPSAPLDSIGTFGPEGDFRFSLNDAGRGISDTVPLSIDEALWLGDVFADELLYIAAAGLVPTRFDVSIDEDRIDLSAHGIFLLPRLPDALERYVSEYALDPPRFAHTWGEGPNFRITATYDQGIYARRIPFVMMLSCSYQRVGRMTVAT